MRRFPVWLVVALPMLIAASPTGAEARIVKVKSAPFCAPAHSLALLTDPQAQVYSWPSESASEQLFACMRVGQRRSYVLGPPMPGGGELMLGHEAAPLKQRVTSEDLAGPILAYAQGSATRVPGSASASVVVRNLRTGRLIHRTPTGGSNPPSTTGTDLAPSVVVKRDGSVAWVTVNIEPVSVPCTGPNPCALPQLFRRHATVHVLDKTGNRLLASGTDIEPRSLTLSGSTLSWKQGDQLVSATLR